MALRCREEGHNIWTTRDIISSHPASTAQKRAPVGHFGFRNNLICPFHWIRSKLILCKLSGFLLKKIRIHLIWTKKNLNPFKYICTKLECYCITQIAVITPMHGMNVLSHHLRFSWKFFLLELQFLYSANSIKHVVKFYQVKIISSFFMRGGGGGGGGGVPKSLNFLTCVFWNRCAGWIVWRGG